MYLYQFNKSYILAKFDVGRGTFSNFNDVGIGPGNLASGCFHKTSKGYAAIYGQNENLYFQVNQLKWKLTNSKAKCTYIGKSRASFKIEDEQSCFEIAYDHWTEDALMSDLDDDDSEHDFFAYIIWLLDNKADSAAKQWSENNSKDPAELAVS